MHLGVITFALIWISLWKCVVCSPCFFWGTPLYKNGYCYKFETIHLNWNDAHAFCAEDISRAELADPTFITTLASLIQNVIRTSEDWWIGGNKKCQKVSGTDFQEVTEVNCATKQGFICQLYVGDPCQTALPDGEYFNDGNCYILYSNTRTHFGEANASCAVQQSRLAEFHSTDAYYFFKKKMGAIQSSLNNSDIFLGGSDLLHEGVFTWFSTDTNISINDWIPNEPNDWPGDSGESHLCWRVYGGEYLLNDVNGTMKFGIPFCQRDVLNVTYLIVLPGSDDSVVKSSDIHVTSGNLEVTYLHFTQRLNDMQVNTTYDWVTSYHDVIYTIDSSIEMSDTDIYHGVVRLKTTNHVTVVLHHTSGSHIGKTIVFPVHLFTTGYFVLTNASQGSGSQITITALYSGTDVIVKLPRRQLQPFTISVRGYTFQNIDKAMIQLDQLDTASLQSLEDFSGSFVYATKPVVVYSGSKTVQTGSGTWDHTLDMSVPVDSLSTEYVTFPSSSSASDTFRLVALYDNTEIAVYGGTLFNVSISKAGYYQEISPPPGSFYYMKSDPHHPFYVTKISSNPNGACVTSLLPQTLWRSQYDVNTSFHETLYLAMESVHVSDFLEANSAVCYAIEGTSYSGCTLTLSPGYHHIGLNTARFKFSAYGSQSPDSSYCHALGTSDVNGSGNFAVDNNGKMAFPAFQYTNLRDDSPFLPPNLPETTTLLATTTPDSRRTPSAHNFDQTTTGEHDNVTKEQQQPSTAVSDELSATTRQTTETQSEPSLQTPTASSVDTISATAPTASFSNATLLACTALCVPQPNVSKQQLTAITQKITLTLLVNRRDMFLYKQKRKSTWDDRPSCHVIGISGVVMMICWILFLTSPDVFRLFRFFFLPEKKSTRETTR